MPTNYTFDLEPKISALYPKLSSSQVTTIATTIVSAASTDPTQNIANFVDVGPAIVETSIGIGLTDLGSYK